MLIRHLMPLILLLLASKASAGQLNDTGMVRCVAQDGTLSKACSGTGQDGASGRDVDQPKNSDGHLGFDFAKICNSGQAAGAGTCPADPEFGEAPDRWGCTRDKVSGLEWEVFTHDGGIRDKGKRIYYDDVASLVAQINAAGLCGESDWRLPSLEEAQSILYYGRQQPSGGKLSPAIDIAWFPNTESEEIQWTSSALYEGSLDHYILSFQDGSARYDDEMDAASVRVVRGAALTESNRFVAQGDEVTDTATGLTWKRCSEGQTWSGTECEGTIQYYYWQQTFDQAEADSDGDGKAWRVPNIKELESMVLFRKQGGFYISALFPATATNYYWSSTPFANERDTLSNSAYAVYFGDGGFVPNQMAAPGTGAALRLVRNTN